MIQKVTQKIRLLLLCLYKSVRILRFVKTILLFIRNRVNETFRCYKIRKLNTFIFLPWRVWREYFVKFLYHRRQNPSWYKAAIFRLLSHLVNYLFEQTVRLKNKNICRLFLNASSTLYFQFTSLQYSTCVREYAYRNVLTAFAHIHKPQLKIEVQMTSTKFLLREGS
jgi:hypothetical protein